MTAAKTLSRNEYKRRFEEALRLRDAGRLDEAESELRALVRERTKHSAALLILGGIQLDGKRYADAANSFTKLVAQQPASEKASLGLFVSLWHLGRREEACAEMCRYLDAYESLEYRRLRRDLNAKGIGTPC